MKLADSWVDDEPNLVPPTAFHDEVEEHDDVDEGKDGCVWVRWQSYVLIKPQTSNKQLHELARETRGVEKRRGKKLALVQYTAIFKKWEAASLRFLRPGHDYFTEFLAKLDCVTVPNGETLLAAFERAKLRKPPSKVSRVPNDGVRLFASLCRELNEMGGGQPIMLHQESIAKLFGHSHWRTIGNWIKALKTLDVLKLAEPAIREHQAARYWYVA